MSRTITVCPECGSPRLRKKTGSLGGEPGYLCNGHGGHVDDPVEREALRDGSESPTTQALLEMDPDDVGGASA